MKTGKKRLLIVNNNLATGGVQRSLINLLNEIKDDYEITLFLFYNNGEYKQDISCEVQVIESSSYLMLIGASQEQARKLGTVSYLLRGGLALFTKLFGNHIPIGLLISTQKRLTDFDIAISYLHCIEENCFYGGCNEFVLNRVKAAQKIAFLHCDISNYTGNIEKSKLIYQSFDKIAAVSEGCRQNFIKAIPELTAKTFCVHNCHNYSDVISSASDNPVVYRGSGSNIVTVARLSKEKGLLRVIKVVKVLLESGYRLEWHIIGDGIQRDEINTVIVKYKLTEHIHLYGNQINPFRYIKNADLFLLPSFHEAAPMVVEEAKCLGVPVIITNTISAKEMVDEGKEGFICENSENGIYEILKTILDNPELLNKCRKHLAKQKYSNKRALLQFHNLIGERV